MLFFLNVALKSTKQFRTITSCFQESDQFLTKFVFKLLNVTVQLGPGQKGNYDVWLW